MAKTTRTNARKRVEKLDRVLSNLDSVSNYLESVGLSQLAHQLDAAADHVEDTRETLAAL